jgi:aldose 1-epimerase
MENHGILKHARFEHIEQEETLEGGILRASLDITRSNGIENEYYQLFPFKCTLTLEIELYHDQIYYRYHLLNKDTKDLPYGIAIHPFFHKPKNEEVTIQVFASFYMEVDADHLPTGRILPVSGSYDLRTPKKVDDLALDDVYLVHPPEIAAVIHYQDKNVILSSSTEFEKLVVYTPVNAPYFCLENQTCSTDAINLYTRGFVRESSLIILRPNESKQGFIKIAIESTR